MVTDTFLNLPDEKKIKIIEKGVEIFTKYSYSEASTNQITRELAISKGSLFSYFDSKKGFYLYLLETCINQLLPITHEVKATEFYDILFESMDHKTRLYSSGYKKYIFFVNRAAKELNEEVQEDKDKIIGKYMLKAQQDSAFVLKKAIGSLNIKESDKAEKLLLGMSMYINAIVNRYLAIYKDKPEELYKNEKEIKDEIKEYLDLLLYGVISKE